MDELKKLSFHDAKRSKVNSDDEEVEDKIKSGGEQKVDDICRQAWARAHGVTLSALETLSVQAKNGKS